MGYSRTMSLVAVRSAPRVLTVAILIATAACSDDGVPQGDPQTTASEGGSTGNSESGGSANTTATISQSESDSLTASTDNSGTTDPGSGTGDSSGSTDASSSGSVDTSGDSSTGEPAGECIDAGDCQLVEDCCNCVVLPAGEAPPPCGIMECFATACAPFGGSAAAVCELGSCELAPVPCDATLVACDDVPPDCADGTLPSVDADQSCWTGMCVPAEACDVVPDCASCPDDEVCIERVTHFGPIHSCSPIDPSCDGSASCGCMDEVCVSPFDLCSDVAEGISCGCPVC
jgi:hypothetical protein